MSSVNLIRLSIFLLALHSKNSFSKRLFKNSKNISHSFHNRSVLLHHPVKVNNSLKSSRKCCSAGHSLTVNPNGSIHCVSLEDTYHYIPLNEVKREFSTIDNVGFPNCTYISVTNSKYRWFRQESGDMEIGILFLQYPVWLKVTGDHCIDEKFQENKKIFKKGKDHAFSNVNLVHGTKGNNEKTIIFCTPDGLYDYYLKRGLTLFVFVAIVCVHAATITIYIITRKKHTSREWIQFSIFVSECLAFVLLAVGLCLNHHYLWINTITISTYCLMTIYYIITSKFALVIATSVDLLLCIWRPFSALDELSRSKRNYIAISICWIFPALIPGVTILRQYFEQERKSDIIVDSNKRLLAQLPPFYEKISKLVFITEMLINIILAIISIILIKRQHNKKSQTNNENKAKRNINKSFGLYIRLILAAELPFTINFVMLLTLASHSPLSIWWTISRATYLLAAVYTFAHFGLKKLQKRQSNSQSRPGDSSTTN